MPPQRDEPGWRITCPQTEGICSVKELCEDCPLLEGIWIAEPITVPPKVSEPLSKEELLDMVERGEIVLAPKPRTPIVPRYLGDEDDDSLPRKVTEDDEE